MSVLEALHKLTSNRLIIFGAGNHELEFVGCLTYCLLQLSSEMKVAVDSRMKTTWHVSIHSGVESRDDKLTHHQGLTQLNNKIVHFINHTYVIYSIF